MIINTVDNWRVVMLEGKFLETMYIFLDGSLLLSPAVRNDTGRFVCYIYGDLKGSVALVVQDYQVGY